MNYSSLLFASIQSCAQVILVCLTGYMSAKYEIVNPTLQKGLSGLIIKILMPCLLFANIGSDIDLESLIRLWPILVLYVIFAILSGSLGILGGKLLGLTPSRTKFVMTGIIFNNVTSLSLGLLKGIENTSAMKILTRGDDDDTEEAIKRGISYILLSTFLGNLLRWSLGTYLLKKDSNEESDEEVNTDVEQSMSQYLSIYDAEEGGMEQTRTTERTPLIFKSIENKSVTMWKKFLKWVRGVFKTIAEIMNPPLYAAILAIFVGTIPFLKELFFGDNALHATITRTMEYLGTMAVPLNLITLGAQLKSLPRGKGQEMLPAISYIMLCRFIIMPAIGITVVILTKDYYLDDPMLWFVLMLLASGPPAVNCMNLSQITGTFQEEMVALLFYSYAAVAPLIALLVMAMLTVIGKAAPK